MDDIGRRLPSPDGTAPALPDDPACNQVVEILTAYLDGALAARDQRLLEEHLAGCSACREYLDQLRSVIALAGTIEPEDVPEELMTTLLDTFRATRGDRR